MNENIASKAWQTWTIANLIVSGLVIVNGRNAIAQVIPDNTLGDESSVVNPRDATSDGIDGGARRGQNLFHSFQEFNVDAGRGVYFSNPDAVSNIFSRVTGNNISNILGTLGVDGAANLFLINPNGIIFGTNSSLNVQGSFAASTADGIRFGEQGEFSTINPQIPELLTVNPSAYLFNQIVNQNINGIESQGLLVVPQEQNLTLLGGDINLVGSLLNARGGQIELGSIQDSAEVKINSNGGLALPNALMKGDISLSNGAFVDVTSGGSGSINFNAQNLYLLKSTISAGIGEDLGDSEAIAGDITLNINENLNLDDSFIANLLLGEGKSGNISITTASLNAVNGTVLSTGILLGKGEAGSVIIDATDSVIFDGESLSGNPGGSSSSVFTRGEGKAGSISITTGSLRVTNGAQLNAGVSGLGEAGSVIIDATDSVIFDGESLNVLPSGAFSSVNPGAKGKAGGISITTDSLAVTNGAQLSVNASGLGDGGFITINANDSVIFDRQSINGNISGASSQVFPGAEGKAGDISITTGSLAVTNGAILSTGTFGIGDGGSIIINATDSVVFNGEGANSISGAFSSVNQGAEGNTGDITITTDSLTVTNGAQLANGTFGQGDGGSIKIIATDSIILDGIGLIGNISGIFNSINPTGEGDTSDITITTDSLTVTNGAQISSSTFGRGDAGNITINANDSIIFQGQSGAATQVERGAEGDAGNLTIITSSLELIDSAVLFTRTSGRGKGGELNINANSIDLDNSSIISSQSLSAFDAGDIIFNIANSLQVKDSNISTSSTQSTGGSITITAGGDIKLEGNSNITTNVNNGAGGGGDIILTADSIIAFDDSDIFAFAADGRGGNITLDTPVFFGENFTLNSLTSDPEDLEENDRVDINATGAVSGFVDIPDVSFIQNSLTELPDNAIDTDQLVANSCVVRSQEQNGTFIITGRGGFPLRPGNTGISNYPTGEVRNVTNTESQWQPGDPIVEPQGLYRLNNGKLVLSRECS